MGEMGPGSAPTETARAVNPSSAAAAGLLGDTADRDYSGKLGLFNLFAAPELKAAIASLKLDRGMSVLDAGCGTGQALLWLSEAVGADGSVMGIDLSAAHVREARTAAPANVSVLQADLTRLSLAGGSFDLIWSVNTLNHLRDPAAGVRSLTTLLRHGGRLAIGQSALLPELYFAWNSRLERLTNAAVRRYYQDRYGLAEQDLRAARNLLGWLHEASLRNVTVRTSVIERTAPLKPVDEAYLLEAIFRGTWGERLRPYLASDDYDALNCLCDPHHRDFALRRPDFHHIQTFTLAVGERPP
jgi:SAM-dependent methyltransferase